MCLRSWKRKSSIPARRQADSQEFSEYIAPLQDAVDLEIATEEERSLLEAWNKYRVLLNRVDTSVALGMKLFVTHVTVTVITISKVQNVY